MTSRPCSCKLNPSLLMVVLLQYLVPAALLCGRMPPLGLLNKYRRPGDDPITTIYLELVTPHTSTLRWAHHGDRIRRGAAPPTHTRC